MKYNGVTVRIDDIEATVKNGEWTSKDKYLLDILKRVELDPLGPFYVSGYDLALANRAVELFGGKVLTVLKAPKGVIV